MVIALFLLFRIVFKFFMVMEGSFLHYKWTLLFIGSWQTNCYSNCEFINIYFPIETILVIRDVGVQVKTVYLGGRSVSRFIDRSKIADIIINEAITMFHIRVYLAIIVEGEDKMVVVFQVRLFFRFLVSLLYCIFVRMMIDELIRASCFYLILQNV
jgi:hypothetical protein